MARVKLWLMIVFVLTVYCVGGWLFGWLDDEV
jgi:hypothetical protein